MSAKYAILPILSFVAVAVAAQPAPIRIDAHFGDWQGVEPLVSDAGDGGGSVDFGRLWAVSDERYLYLSFETGGEINLQDGNSVRLSLDTDNNAGTGTPRFGIGAELEWTFGDRSGTFKKGSTSRRVEHSDLGLLTMPTVTGNRFEMAIPRGLVLGETLFPSRTIRIVLADGATGDRLPDGDGGVVYELTDGAYSRAPVRLERWNPSHLRILTYNALRDALFAPDNEAAFGRILRATEPNILTFQEVYNTTADEAERLLTRLLPLDGGESWHAERVVGDILVVSRYPILSATALCEQEGVPGTCNGAFRIDLPDAASEDLLALVAHPRCCASGETSRQNEVDQMLAFIRDGRASGAITPETPITITGDMNFVGNRQQPETLVSGEIVNTARFGPAAPPDGDGTPLTDAQPATTGLPATVTWIDPGSDFPPGRLDYMIYTDSVLEPGNGYVLYTPALTIEERLRYGLEARDSYASDHLPVVHDFVLPGLRLGSEHRNGPEGTYLSPPAPNPATGAMTLQYHLAAPGPVSLRLFDLLGRAVRDVQSGYAAEGRHNVRLDLSGLTAAMYVLRLEANGGQSTQALVVL